MFWNKRSNLFLSKTSVTNQKRFKNFDQKNKERLMYFLKLKPLDLLRNFKKLKRINLIFDKVFRVKIPPLACLMNHFRAVINLLQ
jgi:hypothetical protein